MTTFAMLMGLNVRVGMEDTIFKYNGDFGVCGRQWDLRENLKRQNQIVLQLLK
jgi:hypothetical protein